VVMFVCLLLFITLLRTVNGGCLEKRMDVCSLNPEVTQGPYYIASTMRQNITEGKSGVPFTLTVNVIDSATCSVPQTQNLAVEIWHCDPEGIYSHYILQSQGYRNASTDNTTFLRGLQTADINGQVVFYTLFPGWYVGRATHIHLKVHHLGNLTSDGLRYVGGRISHTGQIFFNDTFLDTLYSTMEPYSSYNNRTQSRTLLSSDGIYKGQGGDYGMVSLSIYSNSDPNAAASLSGSITVAINTTFDEGSNGNQIIPEGPSNPPPQGGSPPPGTTIPSRPPASAANTTLNSSSDTDSSSDGASYLWLWIILILAAIVVVVGVGGFFIYKYGLRRSNPVFLN